MFANFLRQRDDVVGMGAGDSDAAVVTESLARPARFAVLYERHQHKVARYVSRRVGSDLAEDLTAEVFVRAFRARATFRAHHETALPWLLGIANHVVADHRRHERRRLSTLERLAALRAETAHTELAELAPEIVHRLRRLPASDRDALLLVAWGELSYTEAAAALGVPVGTVRSRIARARARLAKSVADGVERPAVPPRDVAVKGESNE